MKILLKFKTSNNKISPEYRKVFLSFFKKALSEIADGRYYEKFYISSQRRPFTFAVKLPRPTFSRKEITIEKNELQLVFSTGDSMTGFIFMSAFIAQKGKPFNAPFGNCKFSNRIQKQVLPVRSRYKQLNTKKNA